MKITLAQINPRVGDLEGNYKQAFEIMEQAKKNGVGLVVFPELSVMGYPPKDLLDKPTFLNAVQSYSDKWAALSSETGIIFGSVARIDKNGAKRLQNVAMLALMGQVQGVQAKRLLPTYDVFDEDRYFSPAETIRPIAFKGISLGIGVCEDFWNCKTFWEERLYPDDPVEILCAQNPDILINISASPFCVGKPDVRSKMLSHIAKRFGKPLLYVNQIGGNDDVIYDGRSMIFDQAGNMVNWLEPFKPDCQTIDVEFSISERNHTEICQPLGAPVRLVSAYHRDEAEEIYEALVLGTRDYARKTGFNQAVLGLSGGIDSALVAVIAAEAFGPQNVLGVGMPSKYSSDHSVSDARMIARQLGIEFEIIPIKAPHAAYMETLGTRLKADPSNVKPWEENIQARARGMTLMAISNEENRLLLTTGNKSEVAVGYCTLYGDTCGGLAVIADVFKTKVYDVSRWINKRAGKEIIPEGSINKPPSAELRPNQKDQDSLPPYPVLDFILRLYIEHALEADEILSRIQTGDMPSDVEVQIAVVDKSVQKRLIEDIIRKVDRNEYKRRQLAPGLKITKKAFGTGRQMPIAQGWH